MLSSHKMVEKPFFGKGKYQTKEFWMALIRQILVASYISKEIEQYGVLKIQRRGLEYLQNPVPFFMTKDHVYGEQDEDNTNVHLLAGNMSGSTDETLMKMLQSLRKQIAKKMGVPPFAVFQDNSLDSMCLLYPTDLKKLSNVHGVGQGKAKKYGAEFVKLIAAYVKENDIVTPDDLMLKGTGVKSGLKLYIIQAIDRKVSLPDMAHAKGLDMLELVEKIETIVYSGTKLNVKYYLDEIFEPDQQEEIMDYFMDAETDDIQKALEEFEYEYEEEEMRLMRIRFMNEVAN